MRVPDEILQCVCFICSAYSENAWRVARYGGTGFFVSVPSQSHDGTHYIYLLTARHCVEKARSMGKLIIRMSIRSGGGDERGGG